jgi:hypothetical protein
MIKQATRSIFVAFLNERDLLGGLRTDSKDVEQLLVQRRQRKLADPSILRFREYLRDKMTRQMEDQDLRLLEDPKERRKRELEVQFGRVGNISLREMFTRRDLYSPGKLLGLSR